MGEQHPNIQLIHHFFAAYSTNDLQGIRNVLAGDIKWHIPGRHALSGTKQGVDEVLAYFTQLQAFNFKASPILMGMNDDYVIDCHLNWSNLPGEENVQKMSCLLWKFKDGMISEVWNFPEEQHVVDAFFNKHAVTV